MGRCEQQQKEGFLLHANQNRYMQKETNRFTILGVLEACATGETNEKGAEGVSFTNEESDVLSASPVQLDRQQEEVLLGDTHSILGMTHLTEIGAQQHMLPISCNSQRQQTSGANVQAGNVGEGGSQQEEDGGECRRSTRVRRPVQRELGSSEAEVAASSVRGKKDVRKNRRGKGATVSRPEVDKEPGSSEEYVLGDNREEELDGVSSDEGSPVGVPWYNHVKEILQGDINGNEDDIEPNGNPSNLNDSDRWVNHEGRVDGEVLEDIFDGKRLPGSHRGGSISIHLPSNGNERDIQLLVGQKEVEKATSKEGNGESTMTQGNKAKRKKEKSSGKKKNSPKKSNDPKTKH